MTENKKETTADDADMKICGNPLCVRGVWNGVKGRPRNGLCDKCDGHRALVASVIYAIQCLGQSIAGTTMRTAAGGVIAAPPPSPSGARRAAETLLNELDQPWGSP